MKIISLYHFALAALMTARGDKNLTAISNNAGGYHPDGKITRYAEEAVETRWLLLKKGTDDNEVGICGAADKPVASAYDEAEIDDPIGAWYLGATPGTRLGISAKALAVGAELFTAADGKITDTAVDGCYFVGYAVSPAGGADEEFEFLPVLSRVAEDVP